MFHSNMKFDWMSTLKIVIFRSYDLPLLESLIIRNVKLLLPNKWPTQNSDLLHPELVTLFVVKHFQSVI